MEQRICDYVKSRPEPDFFHQPDDQALLQIHEDIKHSIEKATDTMTVDLDEDLIRRAEKVLGAIGWTVEEALVFFLYWCISCPAQLEAWAKKNGLSEEVSVSNTGAMSLDRHALEAHTAVCGNTAADPNEGET